MSELQVLLYDDINFLGTETKKPLLVFNTNLFPGVTTMKSARVPRGVYFTVFSDGTEKDLTAGPSKTYTSDVSDITTFSKKITGYLIQSSTIPLDYYRRVEKYFPCVLYSESWKGGSQIIQLNGGESSTQKINTAVSIDVGTNNVTIIDDKTQPFTFYKDVDYLPAYLTSITFISVVSLPIESPLPSATVIAAATTTTTSPQSASPNIVSPPTPTPTPTPDKTSSDKKDTIVSFLYKHMFTIIILIFVVAMIYYGLNYTKINNIVETKVTNTK
jgi:hypothetical protein